jgi:endo-1,4-beta-xylanase
MSAPRQVDPAVRHRTGRVDLTVLDDTGEPLRSTVVTVEQRSHAFGFGAIGFDFLAPIGGPAPEGAEEVEAFGGAEGLDLDLLADAWLGLFGQVTLPFYWGRYEPRRGRPDEHRLRAVAQWFADRGATVKGHPLVWHTALPRWQADLSLAEIERLQRDRIAHLVGGFRGLIDVWDAINEAVIMPVFANGANRITDLARARGRVAMVRMAVEEARAANPDAVLLINDFDLSPAYEHLIEEVLDAGIAIDAIGLQTHMHKGLRDQDQLVAVLDRFARFGLPLHMTENTLVSGHLMPPEVADLNDYRIPDWPTTPEGEDRQATDLVRHYRTLVEHPAVEVVTYWGLTDAGSWLGAPTGLLRADGSRKPAYDALHAVIRGAWWLAPTAMRTDDAGRVAVDGFAGEYRVSADGADASFRLPPGASTAAANLRSAGGAGLP